MLIRTVDWHSLSYLMEWEWLGEERQAGDIRINQIYPIIYKQVNPENLLWKCRTFCLTSYNDSRPLDRPDKGDSVKEIQTQKIPITKNKKLNARNTIDMYDHDKDTADSRNPEDKESLSLWAKRGCGYWDCLSAGLWETRQKEERLGWIRLPIWIPDKEKSDWRYFLLTISVLIPDKSIWQSLQKIVSHSKISFGESGWSSPFSMSRCEGFPDKREIDLGIMPLTGQTLH